MTQLPSSTRSALLVVALLAGVALWPPRPIAGQGAAAPGDAEMRGFQRISDYVLSVNGKEVGSEIYQSQSASALLIISSALPSPVLLSPANGQAQTVNLMKVEKKPDGSIDLLAGAVLAVQGPIELQDEEVGFKADGKVGLLKPMPPLLGMHRAEEVTAHNPEYVPRAAAYTTNGQAVATLKKEQRPVTVRIFFGSWCPHCREMVPHAVKLEQQLKGTSIHFEYFGLPPRFGTDAAARKNAISAVPTGIVYVSGNEIGRLTGLMWNSPETALVTILTSGKS
jgi:thiol-disulfide isomerase/thioredoxin